ncbi:MAG: efflux RND transporter periplasmic adaptor subunit [Gemmataceae bacterium]|nr:efflux RND transporter periplasmic adaptor subunit [Gemmataceae bacterium]
MHDHTQTATMPGAAPSAPPGSRPTWAGTTALRWLLGRAVPNLLVLFALGALAYWGHSTGWKLPRFSELTGAGGIGTDDWCGEHAVPETFCVECRPGLLPRGKRHGWCSIHGVHECPLEHPDVAQLKVTPQVTAADLERARRALAFADRPVNSSRCKLHLRRVQFSSDDAATKAGVEVTEALRGAIAESVAANGEITYDPVRVAPVATSVPGRVWRVYRELGEPVKKGDVLALVDAVEVGRTRAELLQALSQVELRRRTVARLAPLADGGVSAAQLQEAQAALRDAQIRAAAAQQALVNFGLPVKTEDVQKLTPEDAARALPLLGLPAEVARELDPATTTANLLPLRAPLDGVVIARRAVAGELADASRPLFVVADTARMVLSLGVRQEDAHLVRVGQEVRFRLGGGREVVGAVAWVSTEADEKTRTVQVRAALDNADGRLRAHTFGSGRIVLRREEAAVLVPSEAVQWEGDCHIVFVRDRDYLAPGAPKVFHTRTVRPGATEAGSTEIIAGILPGEVVVTRGSGLMRSELLKNNLGEG